MDLCTVSPAHRSTTSALGMKESPRQCFPQPPDRWSKVAQRSSPARRPGPQSPHDE